MKLIPDPKWWFSLFDLFARPAIGMIGWSMFVQASGLSLPTPDYWSFFWLGIAAAVLESSHPYMKEEE